MAETLSQYQVLTFSSPVPSKDPVDANVVRGNDNILRTKLNAHDSDAGVHLQSSAYIDRPAPGIVGRKWLTIDSGAYQIWYDDGSRWHQVASDSVDVDCRADNAIAKGDVLVITGFNNGLNVPTVDVMSSPSQIAFGVAQRAAAQNALVAVVNTGIIEDVDTNGYAVGTILYPDGAGSWTNTKPASGLYQAFAYVLRGNANNGVIFVECTEPQYVQSTAKTGDTMALRDANGDTAFRNVTLSPSSSLTPANNGDLVIQATSNTQLTFKYKGSDGTVRSGSITLT